MIAAIIQGGSTPGLINYLVGPGRANEHESPHVVAGSQVITRRWGSWEELSPAQGYEIAKFVDAFMTETGTRPTGSVRVLDPATGQRKTVRGRPDHVWHCSLSLSPEEGPLSEERWREVATEFMDEMGFTGADGRAACRWVAIHHGTAKNGGDHIHIAANTVREDGTKWSPWQDQRRAMKACNGIERRHGLTVIEAREHARGARADSHADMRATARRGGGEGPWTTDRARLADRVRAAAVAAGNEADFVVRLRRMGVRVRPRFAAGRTDVVTAYSVALHSRSGQRAQWYGGGRLGRDLTLQRLRARWEDTPQGAAAAVEQWRRAWRGQPPGQVAQAQQVSDWQARADALRVWGKALANVDPTDPHELADATRDVAGLLAAAAKTRCDPHERDVLERAGLAVARHCQTHRRPVPPRPVAGAVQAAARAMSIATADRDTTSMLLVMETIALVREIAQLYDQVAQTETAYELLRDSAAAWQVVHSRPLPAPPRQEYEALAAHPVTATETLPRPAPQPADQGPSDADLEAVGMSREHSERLGRLSALVGAPGAHRPGPGPSSLDQPPAPAAVPRRAPRQGL